MASNRSSPRKSVVHKIVDASAEPAGLAVLARRRRIAHLISAVLLALMIVLLIASPDTDSDGTATEVVGWCGILLMASVVVSVQYTVRLGRLRRPAVAHPSAAPSVPFAATVSEVSIPRRSAAYAPVHELRSAHLLLESALPDIEPVRAGIRATAEHTRAALEQTGQRVLLAEQVLREMTDGAHPNHEQIAGLRHNLQTMTARLQSGVDRYVDLAQEAAVTATSLGNMDGEDNLLEATDQLAGLAEGLKEVQQISGEHT